MEIRKARKSDCHAIAELALMAGEGIPAYFWAQSQLPGQTLEAVGALNAASETENFSFRNTHLAIADSAIAGMLLAYRLPEADHDEDLQDYPEFIRPLIELEQCVPGSFYINMLAAYPQYRNQAIGSKLMEFANQLAVDAGCTLLSVEVFAQNTGALRLYQRLGYATLARRQVIPHPCHPYDGEILLLTKQVVANTTV